MELLSRTEEIVMLSIWKLKGDGAIYAPLHRVEKKGLVRTVKGDPLPERGGRSKVYYEITPKGKKALLETKKVHDSLWVGISSLEFEHE